MEIEELGEGEGEETSAGQDTSQREGVRKSQRIVKGIFDRTSHSLE